MADLVSLMITSSHSPLCARSGRSSFTISLAAANRIRSEEHTSELQSQSNLVFRLLLEKKNDRWNSSSRWQLDYALFSMELTQLQSLIALFPLYCLYGGLLFLPLHHLVNVIRVLYVVYL